MRIAMAACGLLLLWNFYHVWRFFTPVPIVDGWPVLHRIMEAQLGETRWDKYFFRIHGSHLHFSIYALGLVDYFCCGGQQRVQGIISALAIISLSGLLCWILLRHATSLGLNSWATALILFAVVALVASLQDVETLLIPFQAVISVSRLVYVGLLWLMARCLCEGRRNDYGWILGLCIFSTCFHGSGHLFALCIIFLHVLLREPWKRVGFSVLPLVFSVLMQKLYTRGLSEMSMIDKAAEWDSIPQLFYGIFAYFASPLRIFFTEMHISIFPLLWIGAAMFVFSAGFLLHAVWPCLRDRGFFRPRDVSISPLPDMTASKAFFASLALLVLLSAASGALIWVIRMHLPGFGDTPAYVMVLASARYACFSLLSYVCLLYALMGLRFKNANALRLSAAALMAIVGLWSTQIAIRSQLMDLYLNVAATGIVSGAPLFSPDTDAIWPTVGNDAYWRAQLPRALDYMKEHRKGLWYHLPPLGSNATADTSLADVALVHNVTDLLCRLHAQGDAGNSDYLMAITDAQHKVIGYATPLGRKSGLQPIEGFVPCTALKEKLSLAKRR